MAGLEDTEKIKGRAYKPSIVWFLLGRNAVVRSEEVRSAGACVKAVFGSQMILRTYESWKMTSRAFLVS